MMDEITLRELLVRIINSGANLDGIACIDSIPLTQAVTITDLEWTPEELAGNPVRNIVNISTGG